MTAKLVSTDEELKSIVALSHQNHVSVVFDDEKYSDGFITWKYTFGLLKKMHVLHPSVIIKNRAAVAAYALVALKQSSAFHPDLQDMIAHLDEIPYCSRPLGDYPYYIMGQICIDKKYRGKGLFEKLYLKHKELFQYHYEFVVTEISTKNYRSVRAHEKMGFKKIHRYTNQMDEWNVVLWDWT